MFICFLELSSDFVSAICVSLAVPGCFGIIFGKVSDKIGRFSLSLIHMK